MGGGEKKKGDAEFLREGGAIFLKSSGGRTPGEKHCRPHFGVRRKETKLGIKLGP